jgi:hypothetical protein
MLKIIVGCFLADTNLNLKVLFSSLNQKQSIMIKHFLLIALTFGCIAASAQFDLHFHDRTLRIDYVHGGNSDTEYYFIDELLDEPYWGGSKVNLVDTLGYGDYFFEVVDVSNRRCDLFARLQHAFPRVANN